MVIINDIKLTTNMAYGSLKLSDGSFALIVSHNDFDPSDYEWDQYLDYCNSMIDKYQFSKSFIQSNGGGPSKLQIKKMHSSIYIKWRDLKIKPQICVFSPLKYNNTVNALLRMKVLLTRGVTWLRGSNYINYTSDKIEALILSNLLDDSDTVINAADWLGKILQTYNEKS